LKATDLTIANVREAMLKMFIILADAKSLYTLKSKVALMQSVWDFPAVKEEKTIIETINTFPNGSKQVKSMGISYTRLVAATEIQTYASVKATQELFDETQNVILPQMQEAAKSAFIKAEKHYMKSKKSSIIETSFIPIVGQEKARKELAAAKQEAMGKGMDAAKTNKQTKNAANQNKNLHKSLMMHLISRRMLKTSLKKIVLQGSQSKAKKNQQTAGYPLAHPMTAAAFPR